MELGAHVWLRRDKSHWGWVPAIITHKNEVVVQHVKMINLTLRDDSSIEVSKEFQRRRNTDRSNYFANAEKFEVIVTVDPEQLKTADHADIKLRNLPTSYQLSGEDPEAGVITSPSTKLDEQVVGGVNDLIGLTHLHEPAILHALRLRYDANIIYTATGPILIAINPFKSMELYSENTMELYRSQGEQGLSSASKADDNFSTPFKRSQQKNTTTNKRLPPHVYQTSDDAYRAMMRGLENKALMGTPRRELHRGESMIQTMQFGTPTNQSILVSGESGAGKTVTTKIVLNYLAMLSKKRADADQRSSPMKNPQKSPVSETVSIEQQVLQSNPILESFGNARTIRNDNSSRFGKYIDIRFTTTGKLSGASIETYLLEKVRLIRPSTGERNYHIFYQFLSSATRKEREVFYIDNMHYGDFRLLCESGTFDRRDGVSDDVNHQEMLDAMITIGFSPETIMSLMRLVTAVLFAGNMTFTPSADGESCRLDKTEAALKAAALLGVSFEGLASSLTERVIYAGLEVVNKPLHKEESTKACEALIKAVYGAAFDFIVEKVNASIVEDTTSHGSSAASIGVLDIFGFETFNINNFEQICINYTNEALQQQFNKYVFKLEQQEYEREGILWKFISFPDNQDVLDLIDMKHTGILSLLDEQCILPKSTDQKFTRYLYARCDKHPRFNATSAQRVDYKFSIEHYAGYVEYTTDAWLEKNKDQLPAASAALLTSSDFPLIGEIHRFVRSEDRGGRGTVNTKSVGAQFSTQLRLLRARIETTVPHYIRCLKPNDDLIPDYFEPKNVVEQLRCGGVLEAVRVSRAGYPTRYPHEVFMARYYILGDRKDVSPVSPAFTPDRQTDRESDLKRLISKIALGLWRTDIEIMKSMLEAENNRRFSAALPKKFEQRDIPRKRDAGPKINIGDAAPYVPPFNMVVESSVMTPEEKQKGKNSRNIFSTKEKASIGIARPETEAEFKALDFAARCAVAGLQLGRNKVFLRREAFDRIEAMRSEKFFSSAASIQKIVRGKRCRQYFMAMRLAAVIVQSAFRMKLGNRRVVRMRSQKAAIIIQKAWRMKAAQAISLEILMKRKAAATAIQRFFRTSMYKASQIQKELTISEEQVIQSVIRLQAMHRGGLTRTVLLAAATSEESTPLPPPRQAPALSPSPVQQRAPLAIVPVTTTELALNDDIQTELYRQIQEENWSMVEHILDRHPDLAEAVDVNSGELPLHMIARHSGAWTLLIDMVLVLYPKALIHRDQMGALPIHHAAAHDNLAALEIIYSAYKEGINDTDKKGRLPIHVAAEFDAVDTVKFLLSKAPEGAYTMVYRPPNNDGGGLPLHIACRNYASIGVITALLAENFSSAKRTDENGDLPLHLLLRCGEVVDQVVVKTLLTCFANAVSRTDMHGDSPLAIALKHQCRTAVISIILMQYPEAAGVLNGDGHSALFLAFQHSADDRTIMGLLNHAPELATAVDRKTGLLPIQVATENEHSHFIVHNLLKRDMPIDLKEKVRAQLLPHHYSWNHVVSNTDDLYHQVVTKVLQTCTQPQVLALAHVEGPDGKIALAAATPVCKHEIRVMLRLFNTLEVVNQRPAYTNPVSDTQIFYALRYEPPKESNGQFTLLHEDKNDGGDNDYLEDWDDASQVSSMSRNSMRSTLTSRSQQSIEDKLRKIRKEKGQQVIAKLTSRADIVERELKIRKDHHLSRHYVPAIISVHHTVQHAAYSEAMAEPGYCVTMEGADTTAENLMLDLRKKGMVFPPKSLKRIGISLLHMHEHGIVHGDLGTHNIGKFGSRWKLLGVGGSIPIGDPTDPNRGFYHPPESIVVENKRVAIGKKHVSACVVSIPAQTTYDIWAYGVVVYEANAGLPLGPYACRGKRAMSVIEVGKIGHWDENSLIKALKHVENGIARNLLGKLLHPDPSQRVRSLRDVLDHPFFAEGSLHRGNQSDVRTVRSSKEISSSRPATSRQDTTSSSTNNRQAGSSSFGDSKNHGLTKSSVYPPEVTQSSSNSPGDVENRLNGVSTKKSRGRASGNGLSVGSSNAGPASPDASVQSTKSRNFRALGDRFRRQKV